MNEILSELLRVLARDWKTLKDGMLDYHLMKAADMADELERELNEAQAGLDDIEEYGTEEINAAVDLRHQLAAALCERDEAREALRDMLSGWKYIRSVHGDLYGVGWDRAQSKAETALEGTK